MRQISKLTITWFLGWLMFLIPVWDAYRIIITSDFFLGWFHPLVQLGLIFVCLGFCVIAYSTEKMKNLEPTWKRGLK